MPAKRSASEFLPELRGPLTFGAALGALCETEEETLVAFARRLRMSRQHLCDIEQGRKVVSAERAARSARALKQPEAVFVKLELDGTLRAAKLKYTAELHALTTR